MKVDVHIEWSGETRLVGRLHTMDRSAAVLFEYAAEWLGRADAFAIDPTSLPLRAGAHHSPALFGAMQDCGPDRWGRLLVERAVRKHVLDRKPYQDLDYVLALDDATRIGALRFQSAAADTPSMRDRVSLLIACPNGVWARESHIRARFTSCLVAGALQRGLPGRLRRAISLHSVPLGSPCETEFDRSPPRTPFGLPTEGISLRSVSS